VRRPLIGSVLALAVLLSVSAPTSAGAATTVERYTPFTPSGEVKPKLRTSRRSGDCFTSSYAAPRSDTWRCISNSFIYDPCFESPLHSNKVVCVRSPWARRAVILTARLDPSDRVQVRRHPWALVVRRQHCLFAQGATTTFKGKRLNYMCGKRGPYLFGYPNKRRPTWTIAIAQRPDPNRLRRAKISVAWR
jgi:hypothetical protein